MYSFLLKFIGLAKLEFKTGFIYRLQFMASIVITPIILAMYYFIWQSIYSHNAEPSIMGYAFHDMITYYIVSMIIGHIIFNMVGNDLQEKITYGELSRDMLRPMSIFSQLFARTAADRLFAFVTEVIPVFMIALIFFKLSIPDYTLFFAFILASIMALIINFMIGYIMGMLAFWMSRIDSLQWLMFIFVRFLSGEFIPLEFFGGMLFTISKFLPFFYIRYGVIQIYLGKISFLESLILILIQAAWCAALYICIRIIWYFALKRHGAVGG